MHLCRVFEMITRQVQIEIDQSLFVVSQIHSFIILAKQSTNCNTTS